MRIKNPEVEAFIANIGAQIVYETHPGVMAGYWPGKDLITVSDDLIFFHKFGEDMHARYYQTLFHELGHWAQSHKRMNTQAADNDEIGLAIEEIVVETASWWLCKRLRITGLNATEAGEHYTKKYEKTAVRLLKKQGRDIREFNVPGRIHQTYMYLLRRGMRQELRAVSL